MSETAAVVRFKMLLNNWPIITQNLRSRHYLFNVQYLRNNAT